MGNTLYTNRPTGMGGPLSMRRDGQSQFIVPDFQGNTRQLTNNTQTVTDTLITDAWGVQKAATGATVNPYKAFGQYGYFTDTPSRQYVRARHLRVDQGRWISRDPIGFDGGDWNLYGYSYNNPITYIDPSGTDGILKALAEVLCKTFKWGLPCPPAAVAACIASTPPKWEYGGCYVIIGVYKLIPIPIICCTPKKKPYPWMKNPYPLAPGHFADFSLCVSKCLVNAGVSGFPNEWWEKLAVAYCLAKCSYKLLCPY